MPSDHEYRRVRWLCRRGTKELDLLTTYYLDNYYVQASDAYRIAFQTMLGYSDPDLHDLFSGVLVSNDEKINKIAKLVISVTPRSKMWGAKGEEKP